MDKVIIDGVDVSECAYITYRDSDNPICSETGQYCKGYDICYYKQLQRAKAELQKYEDMAQKGLDEFKDVGGCWGCGLQLQLNQDIEDIKRLKEEKGGMQILIDNYIALTEKYSQALQEIREIVSKIIDSYIRPYGDFDQLKTILTKINEVIGVE